MINLPLSPDSDGESDKRDKQGRFAPGNKASKGNPHARRLAAWRREWSKAITPAALRRIISVLLEQAQAGERWAVVEVLARTIGKTDTLQVNHHDDNEPTEIRVVVDENFFGNAQRIPSEFFDRQNDDGP